MEPKILELQSELIQLEGRLINNLDDRQERSKALAAISEFANKINTALNEFDPSTPPKTDADRKYESQLREIQSAVKKYLKKGASENDLRKALIDNKEARIKSLQQEFRLIRPPITSETLNQKRAILKTMESDMEAHRNLKTPNPEDKDQTVADFEAWYDQQGKSFGNVQVQHLAPNASEEQRKQALLDKLKKDGENLAEDDAHLLNALSSNESEKINAAQAAIQRNAPLLQPYKDEVARLKKAFENEKVQLKLQEGSMQPEVYRQKLRDVDAKLGDVNLLEKQIGIYERSVEKFHDFVDHKEEDKEESESVVFHYPKAPSVATTPQPPLSHNLKPSPELLRNGTHQVKETNESYEKSDSRITYAQTENAPPEDVKKAIRQIVDHMSQLGWNDVVMEQGGKEFAYECFVAAKEKNMTLHFKDPDVQSYVHNKSGSEFQPQATI